jgi:hypothetical protein
MQIKTYCPKFSGFYETLWAFQYDDIEYSLFNEPDRILKQINDYIIDRLFDYADNTAYENAIAKSYVEVILIKLQEKYPDLIKSIKFESVVSPKRYNFSTDVINIIVDCDFDRLIAEFKKHPQAAEYIKETYTSRSGFSSYYENDLGDWLKTVKRDIGHKTGSMLELLLSDVKEYDIYEDVKSDIYESDFIDYDKLIEDVNDNFGISIKSLSELENFEETHGRILSSEERQFLSTLYGVEDDVDGIATKANLIPVKFPEFAN